MNFQNRGDIGHVLKEEDDKKPPDSQESLILLSQGTYECIELSQKTDELMQEVMNEGSSASHVVHGVPVHSVPVHSVPVHGVPVHRGPVHQERVSNEDAHPKPNALCFENYDFRISFISDDRYSKSCPWTYSKLLNKVFLDMNQYCPFAVHVDKPPPPGTFLRLALFYKRDEDFNKFPIRCGMHSMHSDSTNIGHDYPYHLIRSDLKEAIYVTDLKGRHSVLIPFTHSGKRPIPFNFKIMCRNSCEGGLSRRPTVLVFTLEDRDRCLGTYSIDIRACSCPGRDRSDEELKRHPNLAAHSELLMDLKRKFQMQNSELPPTKRVKTHEVTQKGHYEIVVQNRAVFKILEALKVILDASEAGMNLRNLQREHHSK